MFGYETKQQFQQCDDRIGLKLLRVNAIVQNMIYNLVRNKGITKDCHSLKVSYCAAVYKTKMTDSSLKTKQDFCLTTEFMYIEANFSIKRSAV